MENASRNLLLTLIAGALILSPVFASADSKGKSKSEKNQEKIEKRLKKEAEKQAKKEKKEEEKQEKEEKRNKRSENTENKCLRAWGHLVAFGWLKQNSSVSVDLDDCNFPFGIAKKFRRATTTPDTIAPVISGIATFTGRNKALVVWNTDEKATGKLYYSTTSPVNLSTSPAIDGTRGLAGKSHFAGLGGLATGTTYYFVVEAKDKAGNISRSSQMSFTTKSGTLPTDTISPIINSINSSVGTSSIAVSWSTNEVATSKVYYSTTTPINLSLANFVQSGSLSLSHSLLISGLATGTPYYLLIESADSAANVATSSAFATTTLAQ